MPFSRLGFSPDISPALLRALSEKGYAEPTPIQLAAIPVVLAGGDLLASAQTGSGKTAAFVLPLLQQCALASVAAGAVAPSRTVKPVHSVVLVPTRELAQQVGEAFKSLAQFLPCRVKISVLYGGVSINPQMMHLRGGTDVVVATPGRLLDLLAHNALRIDQVRALVLDEADRMLDLGFGEELQRILAMLPKRRQSLFFSATMPPAIEALAAAMLHQPQRIAVQTLEGTAPDIAQRVIEVDTPRRTQLLKHLIQTEQWQRVLVFAATQHATEIVAVKLRSAGIAAEPFHGDLSQGKRNQVLMDFKANTLQVVVATDVAARGIDIVQLPVVVNYDLPRAAVDYTHRIGRTGRAGHSGLAVSFVSAGTQGHFRLIEKRQGLSLPREQVAGFEPTVLAAEQAGDKNAPSASGGIKGARPNKKDKLRAAAQLAGVQLAAVPAVAKHSVASHAAPHPAA